MKLPKIILFLATISGILIVPSCVSLCPDVETFPFFDIKGMKAHAYQELPFRVALTEGDTVNFDEFGGIEVNFTVDYLGQSIPKPSLGISLFPKAYACSLLPNGTEGAKEERFAEINIYTRSDFDEAHPEGSSMNDLFAVVRNGDTTLVNDFIAQVNENVEYETLFLVLQKAPQQEIEFAMEVKVGFTNLESYVWAIEDITLKP